MNQPLSLSDLTDAERAWLGRLSTGRWKRAAGGYRCAGRPVLLGLTMFDRLSAKRLVVETRSGGDPKAELSSLGRQFLEIDRQRKAQRQGGRSA